MRKIRHVFLYYALLSKRFFKKLSFVLLLCAVPLLVLCLKNVSGKDTGMLDILLYMENPEEEEVQNLTDKLLNSDSVITYSMVEDVETGRRMVSRGEADALWIFKEDFVNRTQEIISKGMKGEGILTVVEQEDNVAMQLARIKLFGAMYPVLSYALCKDFAYSDLGIEADDEELRSYFQSYDNESELFLLDYIDGEGTPAAQKQNYLTAPLRGMLALLIILCGFAADMFFMQDREQGVLDAFPVKRRQWAVYIYQLAAMIPVTVAVLVALYLIRDFTGVGRELLLAALYLLDCMVFCNLVRKLCGTAGRLGAAIPILILGMLVICPIFFNFRNLRMIQYFLPPFYYLNAAHVSLEAMDIAGMLLYVAVGGAVDFVTGRIGLHKA
ncbi:MAG: ABC transporter permease [Acetatifactor sp.]